MGITSPPPPENVSSDQKRVVIGELIHGRNLATQLQILLRDEPFSQQRSESAEDLVVKIRRSFTETLAVLRGYDQYSGGAAGGDAAEIRSCKGVKNRRGCYKRRKISETRTEVSCTIEDGHAWRKYGQKEILNAKFPRSYYRCTRKHDQGCRAMKQVQRMEGDIIQYHTTYIGHHTCRDINIPKIPQFIIGGSCLISYDPIDKVGSESKVQETKPEVVKEEEEEEEEEEETVVSDDVSADNVSSLDSINLWSGLGALDSYMPAMVSPRRGSDNGDNGDNTDLVLECLDFQNGNIQFHFDESPVQFF